MTFRTLSPNGHCNTACGQSGPCAPVLVREKPSHSGHLHKHEPADEGPGALAEKNKRNTRKQNKERHVTPFFMVLSKKKN